MTLGPRSTVLMMTAVVWVIAVFILEAFRIYSVMTGPPPPDAYGSDLEYQLVVSVLMVATRWLPVLGAVLLLELVIFLLVPRSRRRARSRRSAESEEY